MAGRGGMEWEVGRRRDSEDVIVLSPGPPVRRRPPPVKAVEPASGGVAYEPPEKLFYKTRVCETFVTSGRCMYEDGCTFAHGDEELRPSLTACAGGWRKPSPAAAVAVAPPVAVAPTPTPPPAQVVHADLLARGSGYGGGHRAITKVCFEFRDKGTCYFGETCAFPHVSAAEIRQGSRLSLMSSELPARRSVAVTVPRTFVSVPPVAPPPYYRVNNNSGYNAASMAAAAPAAASDANLLAQQPPEQEGRKMTRLEMLSRKKMTGIYGDWPEGFERP